MKRTMMRRIVETVSGVATAANATGTRYCLRPREPAEADPAALAVLGYGCRNGCEEAACKVATEI
jgi:hypothetical protein